MNFKNLSIWVLFQICVFILGFFLQKENPELSVLNQLGFSVFISRGAGLCLAITPLIMLFPMCRHTITFLRKLNIPYIDFMFPNFSILFHKICAYTILFWSIVHTVSHYVNFYGVEIILEINTIFNLHYTIFAGISGHIMLLSLFFIFSTSTLYFRKYYFDLFWFLHHFYILFFIGVQFHGIGCFVQTNNEACVPYYSAVILSPVLLLYIIERFLREIQPYRMIKDVKFCEPDILKLSFEKTKLNYKPGQYLLLKCEKISTIEWHPFSISSSPNDDLIEVTIRCLGDWTKKFKQCLSENVKNEQEFPLIQVDGVFGSPIDTIMDYNSVILIASGIGITPYISMIRYIIENSKIKNYNLKKIDLIWINKKIEYFEWFNKELNFIDKNNSILTVNLYMHVTEKITDKKRLEYLSSKEMNFLNYIYKTDIQVYYGRPDIDSFINRYSKNNDNLKTGCFVCGSKKLEIDVKESCKKYSNKNIKIVFISERI